MFGAKEEGMHDAVHWQDISGPLWGICSDHTRSDNVKPEVEVGDMSA